MKILKKAALCVLLLLLLCKGVFITYALIKEHLLESNNFSGESVITAKENPAPETEADAQLTRKYDLNNIAVIPKSNVYEYLKQARIHFFEHDYDKALLLLDQAEKINPEEAAVFIQRSEIYRKLEDLPLALEEIEKAESITRAQLNHPSRRYKQPGDDNPKIPNALNAKHSMVLYVKGNIYLETKQPEKALLILKECQTFTNNLHKGALHRMGDAYYYLGQYDEAFKTWQECADEEGIPSDQARDKLEMLKEIERTQGREALPRLIP